MDGSPKEAEVGKDGATVCSTSDTGGFNGSTIRLSRGRSSKPLLPELEVRSGMAMLVPGSAGSPPSMRMV